MRYKIAICDDEKIIHRDVIQKLKDSSEWIDCDVDSYYNGAGILNASKYYDIIFLDIDLQQDNGMQIASILRERGIGSYIIFITSHENFMQDAFKVSAFRYLCKPIQLPEFAEAVHSAKKQILGNDSIVIRVGGDIKKIKRNNIVCIESYGDGTFVYTVDECLETRRSLKAWLEILDEKDYFQTHKSYIVSFRHVKSVTALEIEMQHMKTAVPISHRKQKSFKDALMNFMTENK